MNEIGVYGLGVMGKSICRNFANHGISVSAFNIDKEITKVFCRDYPLVKGFTKLKDFIDSLDRPRKILLMVTAGKVVDEVMEELIPLLERNDIVIDGGNSFFRDTERRQRELKANYGIDFIGCGISGGEKGALEGPSIMPSGSKEAYLKIDNLFQLVSAKNGDGSSCCTYIGNGGSGHFVKMIHNGIEYSEMQLLAELYTFCKANGLGNEEIAFNLSQLNHGYLKSFLLDITCSVLKKKDDNNYLIDRIKDVAYQKGTGKWASIESLRLGIDATSIIEAVEARIMSEDVENRQNLCKIYVTQSNDPRKISITKLENAYLAARVLLYAQGFSMIQTVSKNEDYGIDLSKIAKIWQSGCILQSKLLELVEKSIGSSGMNNLLYNKDISILIKKGIPLLKELVSDMIDCNLYSPVFISTLEYYFGKTSMLLGANLIQAQRDYFGAHTYERIDKEGFFHTNWYD